MCNSSRFAQTSEQLKRYCSTVEGVISELGVHEFYGHIVRGWGDKNQKHHAVYALQIAHDSWEKLPSDMQKDIILQFHTYYQEEVLLPLLIKLILTK